MIVSSNGKRFDASLLCKEYADKSSLNRYHELYITFPNTLIIFEHADYYYGFEETAVALYYLFGCKFYKQKGMLVTKTDATMFEEHFVGKRQMRGYRYIIDRNGKLTFVNGKGCFLKKPLSYYNSIDLDRIQKAKLAKSSWTDSYSKHGGGWYNDVWTPGLPSQRFFRKKSK